MMQHVVIVTFLLAQKMWRISKLPNSGLSILGGPDCSLQITWRRWKPGFAGFN